MEKQECTSTTVKVTVSSQKISCLTLMKMKTKKMRKKSKRKQKSLKKRNPMRMKRRKRSNIQTKVMMKSQKAARHLLKHMKKCLISIRKYVQRL